MAQLWISMDIDNETQQKIARVQSLLKQQTEADWEDSTSFHITIDFLNNDETDADKIVEALKAYESETTYYNCNLIARGINYFGNTMWMGVDNSMPLYHIKYRIAELLHSFDYHKTKDKFDSYTPHITLAYNTVERVSIDFEPFEVPLSNITLWNSFKCNGAYVENFLYKINLKK